MSSAAASSSARGALLRDINRLSTDILAQHARLQSATARLAEETATKAGLVERIGRAETEHAEVERKKAAESANDAELVGLQRAVGGMTMKRQELIKATKAARGERDRAREEATAAFYARLGAEVEQGRAAAAAGSEEAAAAPAPAPPLWSADTLKLLGEADALWRRSSNAGVVTRDLVDAALQARDLALAASGGGGEEAGEPAGAAAGVTGMYAHLGPVATLADVRRSLEAVQDVLDGATGLRERAGAAARSAGEPDSPAGAALSAVDVLASLVRQHATMQRSLLLAVEAAVAPAAEAVAAAEAAAEGEAAGAVEEAEGGGGGRG
jgi:hypothetical protein